MNDQNEVLWRRAAVLTERASGSEWDHTLAAQREARWGRLPVFAQSYASRDEAIEPLGATFKELQQLLGETDVTFAPSADSTQHLQWHDDFERWWAIGEVTDRSQERELGLLEVLYPLITGARQELLEDMVTVVARYPESWKKALEHLAGSLTDNPPFDELGAICGPTLILELNVAREEGRLDGADSGQRYESFLESLRSTVVARDLLDEYPVLQRLVVTRLQFWATRALQLITDFGDDAESLSSEFWRGEKPHDLVATFGSGDSHRQGRSVAVLRTVLGNVVYKPRSPAMDAAFDNVVDWFNECSPPHLLKSPRLIGRADHGWYEFIDGQSKTDGDGADRFAWRAGALTALLHMLRATDFHFENIVAEGEYPVPVDLETLLHVDKQSSTAAPEDDARLSVALDALAESVFSIGILPTKIITGDPSELFAVDISAIGGGGGQEGMFETPTVREDGTDQMHVTNGRAKIEAQLNRPASTVGGDQHSIVSRHSHFAEGFRWSYDLVRQKKDAWTSPGGLLDLFANTRTRTIARPTAVYGKLLMESYHPDFLRDALDRNMCLSKLLAGYFGRADRVPMIASELEATLVGDIPFFEVHATTGVVTNGSDEVTITTRPEAPLSIVRRFLQETVGSEDQDEQLRVIKYAFAAASNGAVGGLGSPPLVTEISTTQDAPDRVSCAVEICHRLLDQAFERDGYLGWIGLTFLAERWWTVNPAGSDAYTGLAGIALSLATVGDVSKDERIIQAARGLFDQLAITAEYAGQATRTARNGKLPVALDSGGFGVLSGLMYALAQAHARYGDTRYKTAAREVLLPLADVCRRDENFDVVAGNAGALLAVVALAEIDPDADTSDVIDACLDRIEAGAISDATGIRWPAAGGSTPLVGYSHGSLGVAVALARLQSWDSRYKSRTTPLIEGAMKFERTHWDPDSGDWADLREENVGKGETMRAWCHGSAGAILGRTALLSMPTTLDRAQLVTEIRSGLLSTEESTRVRLGQPYGQGNHSLCHGDLGNLICSETALFHVTDASHIVSSNADAWTNALVQGSTTGWRSSSPSSVETPGLMMGLAGIAWALAYSVSRETEPNLLLLEGASRLTSVSSSVDVQGVHG